MRRIESSGNRQTQLDAHGNPVAKEHTPFSKIIADDNVPFRQVVNTKGSARFKNPLAVL